MIFTTVKEPISAQESLHILHNQDTREQTGQRRGAQVSPVDSCSEGVVKCSSLDLLM